MPDERQSEAAFASSTGHDASAGEWLDAHFEASRHEYEAMLRSVGIQPGWHILDAGSGSYLPSLADIVGPTGQLVALDLAPENTVLTEQRLAEWRLPTPVEVRLGSILDLPYPDGQFDAVWCASTTQYLTDAELRVALAELRRVVRPGGLVAIKDAEMGHWMNFPVPAPLIWHWLEAWYHQSAHGRGVQRGRALRAWLVEAELEAVWQRTTLIERWQPLRPVERLLYGQMLVYVLGLPEVAREDHDAWRPLADPASPAYLPDQPDFYCCEAHVLAVGRLPAVPDDSG